LTDNLFNLQDNLQSPGFLRMSLAAAMTLGFKNGLFYRNAKLYCINLLLTYPEGCAARCAYCGLSGNRPGQYTEKRFIRVTWPIYALEDIIQRILERTHRVKRICISMITRKRCVPDTLDICRKLRNAVDIPVSILVSPTLLKYEDLQALKNAGADKIGVAVDLATEPLFIQYRGKGVGGPHQWDRYWECLRQGVEIFGNGNAGPHFMAGMGETEKEMSLAMQKSRDMGGRTHLFSFFPEAGSLLENKGMPPMDQYRRIQLARYLIDHELSRADGFSFDQDQRILHYGLSSEQLETVVNSGEPFRTSGCSGNDGEVACNRPFANSRPGPDIRNFPFLPDAGDIENIRRQLNFPCSNKTVTIQRK